MKTVKPYSHFSQIYSHLMESVDYKFWADYISDLHQGLGRKSDIALELAAGNGRLSEYLGKRFKKLYLTDFSFEMLNSYNGKLPKICCDMIDLPFNIQFDFIFSAFDSINYLNTNSKLKKFFKAIKNNLAVNGYFVFDVSMQHNSIKHLKKLNRKGIYNKIKYEQISSFDIEKKIHINTIHLELPNGKFMKEVHTQKIYDFYYYFEVMEYAGLFVAECFDAFSFDDGTPNSDRVQFVVKRKN